MNPGRFCLVTSAYQCRKNCGRSHGSSGSDLRPLRKDFHWTSKNFCPWAQEVLRACRGTADMYSIYCRGWKENFEELQSLTEPSSVKETPPEDLREPLQIHWQRCCLVQDVRTDSDLSWDDNSSVHHGLFGLGCGQHLCTGRLRWWFPLEVFQAGDPEWDQNLLVWLGRPQKSGIRLSLQVTWLWWMDMFLQADTSDERWGQSAACFCNVFYCWQEC